MELHPPKKTSAGYFLRCESPVRMPSLRFADKWVLTAEWKAAADRIRSATITKLVTSPRWFTKPPRQEVLEPLFSPWAVQKGAAVELQCRSPDIPGVAGEAVWCLTGIIMSGTDISPMWEVVDVKMDDTTDAISIFGGSDEGEEEAETREIHLDDISEALPVGEPTRIRNREWERRKFIAKEMVRETRLKAVLATRMARKEEARFYAQFGEMDDGESHFSEYDLTDEDSLSSSDDEEADEM
jgi:hypothetical protein